MLQAITGKDTRQAAEDVLSLCSSYLEVDRVFVHFRFLGRGQRDTPVVDVRGVVEIVMLLPGHHLALTELWCQRSQVSMLKSSLS